MLIYFCRSCRAAFLGPGYWSCPCEASVFDLESEHVDVNRVYGAGLVLTIREAVFQNQSLPVVRFEGESVAGSGQDQIPSPQTIFLEEVRRLSSLVDQPLWQYSWQLSTRFSAPRTDRASVS